MESIKDDEDDNENNNLLKCSTDNKFHRSMSEKRVEFSIGVPKSKSKQNLKLKPKSALKRFTIDTHR